MTGVTLTTPVVWRLEKRRQHSTGQAAAFSFSSPLRSESKRAEPASPFASQQYLRCIICDYKPLYRAKVLMDLLGFTKGFLQPA